MNESNWEAAHADATAPEAEQTYDLHYVFVDGEGTPSQHASRDAAIAYAVQDTIESGAHICTIYDDDNVSWDNEGDGCWDFTDACGFVVNGRVYDERGDPITAQVTHRPDAHAAQIAALEAEIARLRGGPWEVAMIDRSFSGSYLYHSDGRWAAWYYSAGSWISSFSGHTAKRLDKASARAAVIAVLGAPVNTTKASEA